MPTQDGSRRRVTRRTVVASLAAGVAGLAGCLGSDDGSTDEDEDEDGDGKEDLSDVDPQLRLDGTALTDSFPIQFLDPQSEQSVAEVHWHGTEYSHWHFMPFEVPLDGWRPVRAQFLDRDLDPIPLGEDETHQIAVERTEGTPSDLVGIEIDGNLVNFHGTSLGEGELIFHLASDGEEVWTSPPFEVAVVEEIEE